MDKISEWGKWDLHIHTKASNVKKTYDYPGGGISFTDSDIDSFLENLFTKSNLKLCAITDWYGNPFLNSI